MTIYLPEKNIVKLNQLNESILSGKEKKSKTSILYNTNCRWRTFLTENLTRTYKSEKQEMFTCIYIRMPVIWLFKATVLSFLLISVLTNKANKEDVDVAVILVPVLFSLLLLAVFILCLIYKIRINAIWKQTILQVTIDIWMYQLH